MKFLHMTNGLQFLLVAASAITLLVPVLLIADGPASSSAATTYKTKCAMCHAATGSGDTAMGKKLKAKDFRSPDVQKQTDAQLHEIIAKGKGKMPAYEKQLDKEKIKDLVAYARELGRK